MGIAVRADYTVMRTGHEGQPDFGTPDGRPRRFDKKRHAAQVYFSSTATTAVTFVFGFRGNPSGSIDFKIENRELRFKSKCLVTLGKTFIRMTDRDSIVENMNLETKNWKNGSTMKEFFFFQ